MPQPLLLGIDVGTTQLKVGAFDLRGRPVAAVTRPTPATRLGPERAEHDAEGLWQAVSEGIHATVDQLGPGARVGSVGVSSFGESGVLLDRHGRPLAPVPAWFDDRTHERFAAWAADADLDAVRSLTGLHPDPTYGIFKLAWLKDAYPEAVTRAVTWLPVADWIAFRLSGRIQTSASHAARTLALDLRSMTWSDAQLDSLGVASALMPPLRSPGDPVGPVSTEAAAATGLPAGTVVGDTGHDQVMAALGVGGAPGTIVNACGTAETVMAFIEPDGMAKALAVPDLAVGPHAQAGLLYLMATVRAAGSAVDWGVRTLTAGGREGGLEEADYVSAVAAASSSPPGANGVWFVPHLRAAPQGSHLASLKNGHVGGIRETTTPNDLLRAVLEGVSLESGRHLDLLLHVAAAGAPERVVAVGGPTRNQLWMQIKADVFGVPLRAAGPFEGTLWGAALAGARAAGLVGEDDDARPDTGRTYLPGRDRAVYGELQRAYAERLERLAGALHGVNSRRGT